MSGKNKRVPLTPGRQADALAGVLASRGFTTTVYKMTGGHKIHPCVRVRWGAGRYRTEFIYAAPDGGPWRFWWSSLEPIGPIGEVDQAAEVIARALAGDVVPEEVIRL